MTFAVTGIATIIVTEVLRGIVDRRRVQQRGVGGTQDIALWGTLVAGLCFAGAVVSGAGWFITK